ncbi:MAG: hypothetical protein HY420_01140 [Candidatus Kerfeldbacteria bacterium]|nr:hypothetical protein [Candidatus Kerfeldbacteria bacterium]
MAELPRLHPQGVFKQTLSYHPRSMELWFWTELSARLGDGSPAELTFEYQPAMEMTLEELHMDARQALVARLAGINPRVDMRGSVLKDGTHTVTFRIDPR